MIDKLREYRTANPFIFMVVAFIVILGVLGIILTLLNMYVF